MQTSIFIGGQISGNNRLANAIQTHDSVRMNAPFYGYEIMFRTKKEAKKAFWLAYKYLVREEPEFKGAIKYSKDGFLTYDASSAKICRP